MNLHPDWLVPQWPAPPGVRAVCTTRAGGVSRGPYESLNLGQHVGDDPADVAANRQRLADAIGARPVFLSQVHGADSLALLPGTADGGCADAAATAERGLACTMMVADCLPLLFTDREGRRVAAAHAGWRGLAGGVLDTAVGGFDGLCARADVMAWLGPCIGSAAFEVGPEVKAQFEAQDDTSAQCFVPSARAPGKWLADLPALARRRLRALGLAEIHGNDGGAPWCTVGNPSRFFSHRRDRGVSGRFAALVWRA